MNLFTEIFPIEVSSLPRLYLYVVNIDFKTEVSKICGRLAYRLHKEYGGYWINIWNNVITDTHIENDEINKFLEKQQKQEPELFHNITGIFNEKHWKPSSQIIADFVARGLFNNKRIKNDIDNVLKGFTKNIDEVFIKWLVKFQSYIVQNIPSVGIVVIPRLFLEHDLSTYSKTVLDFKSLIGINVCDKNTNLDGVIIDIVGKVNEHNNRQILLSKSKEEKNKETIRKAKENEIIVKVLKGKSTYDYVESALRIVLKHKDFERFNIDYSKIANNERLKITDRIEIVKNVSTIFKEINLIKSHSFNSNEYPHLFIKDFELDKILPFDIITKISISRSFNQNNFILKILANIYLKSGKKLRFIKKVEKLKKKWDLPEFVLRSIFTKSDFASSKVVLVIDGFFHRTDKLALRKWASKMKSDFYFVEILKQNVPKIYDKEETKVSIAKDNTIFKINNTEALLTHSKGNITKIKTELPYIIKSAIQSYLFLIDVDKSL